MENDGLQESIAEDEDIIDLENLPTHFLAVEGQPLYKNLIRNKVMNSQTQQQPSPPVAIPNNNNNKRQPGTAAASKRKGRPAKARRRRKSSSGNEDENTYVYSSVDSSR